VIEVGTLVRINNVTIDGKKLEKGIIIGYDKAGYYRISSYGDIHSIHEEFVTVDPFDVFCN
tara:strand:+ start:674 stop:856 length:183 start_codon:yes stop_codon:yes gene_type:complete